MGSLSETYFSLNFLWTGIMKSPPPVLINDSERLYYSFIKRITPAIANSPLTIHCISDASMDPPPSLSNTLKIHFNFSSGVPSQYNVNGNIFCVYYNILLCSIKSQNILLEVHGTTAIIIKHSKNRVTNKTCLITKS